MSKIELRTEHSMLAVELEASFKERRSPAFNKGSKGEWIDHLLSCNQLELVEHGFRHFKAAFPDQPIGHYLTTVFDMLPPADGFLLRFDDDVEKEVQVVAREGAETVALLFCGAGHRLGLPLLIEHRWHGRQNATLIYLRDFQRCSFLRGLLSFEMNRDRTIAELRRIIDRLEARRIVCYGTSGGVFAALHYGLDLGAEAVLCMAGITNRTPEFNAYTPHEDRMIDLQREMHNVTLDLRLLYMRASRPPRVHIIYGEDCWIDRIHAEHMSALPCATLQPIKNFGGHDVTLELIKRGQFQEALHWLVPPTGV
jgi:hypothetical protein